MSQLIFPILRDGLAVDVRVNRDSATLRSVHAAGQPIPTSIQATGLIDTGSDVSAVSASILQQLAIPPQAHQSTQGIGGMLPVRLFNVTLFILDLTQPHLPWLVQPDLVVMELPSGLPVEVLIGLDVLLTCKLLLDGPALQFTLEF
jgi:hypothetical protein